MAVWKLHTLIDSNNNVPCFCSLVVLKRPGWTIDFKNLDDVTLSTSKLVADLNQTQPNKNYGFRMAPKQWAVYGGALKPGDDLVITGTDMGFGDRVIVAGCDGHSNKLDLQLLNTLGNPLLSYQGQPTNAPF
jgi:hypothetical protein